MLSFPRGAQDKEEARWSPLPLPTTPGQGPATARCPGEHVDAGSSGSSPGERSQPCRGSLSSHPQKATGGRSKHSFYCTAMRQGTSTLTATLNTFKGHNSPPFKH